MKKVLSYTEISDLLIQRFSEAKNLYVVRDYTARQLADHFQVMFTANFQRACFTVLGSKGKGLGGARLGAGNSKSGREHRLKVKASYRTIAVKISPENMEFLQRNTGSSYTDVIDRALVYYRQALSSMSGIPIENEK